MESNNVKEEWKYRRYVQKGNHNSLCITHLKLLDENGKYVKFISPHEAIQYLEGKTIEVVGMSPRAQKKISHRKSLEKKNKDNIQKQIDLIKKRSLLYPQKEFTTL